MDIVGLSRELLTAELERCDLWKSNELQKKHSENNVKTYQTSRSTRFRVSRVHSQSSTVLNAVYVLGKTAILFGILFLQFLAPCYLNPKSSAQDHFLRKVTTLFEAEGIETDLSNQALIKLIKLIKSNEGQRHNIRR